MDYENEGWIKVYTRNTPEWLARPPMERFVLLELSRAMGRATDELALGRLGLRAVCILIQASWEDIGQALAQLIADGELEYDESRQVLREPRHMQRQQTATSSAQRKRDSREKSRRVTPGHAESRQVTASHDQREEKEETEERETRAPEGDADAVEPDEPEPSPPVHDPGAPPAWVDKAIATAELATGETFDRGAVWLKYQGKREAAGATVSAGDFRGFLASWAVQQKSERIREQSRPSGPRLVAGGRQPPDTTPAPYHRLVADEPDDEPEVDYSAALEASRRLVAALA